MNLDKKLELAERVLIAIVQADNRNYNWDAEGVSALSFEVADAMEAEYNKRKQKEIEKGIEQDKEMLGGFQVDWSQAPIGYDWWAVDGCGAWWYDQEPKWINGEWSGYSYAKNGGSATEKAPSFNYQEDWKDSLRERP